MATLAETLPAPSAAPRAEAPGAVSASHALDTPEDVHRLFAVQQAHRWTMARTTAQERIQRLLKLRGAIHAHKADLTAAVHRDFRKNATEFELTELYIVLQELQHTIEHLDEWLMPRPVKTPAVLFGTRSELRLEPKGVVAILAPWNYPFQLTIAPLIAAVAAGNCAIVRPSEKTVHTSEVMKRILRDAFDEREVAMVVGHLDVADAMLELPFDHFFFTGSTRIGKKVMAKAAEHLASVTLELGGKSPAIVDESANVKAAAERIAWGKLVNAGQTCVAPDYALVHESVRDRFIDAVRTSVERAYGSSEEARKQSGDLARMIDDGAFRRVKGLIEEALAIGGRLEVGGQFDAEQRYISPTVISGVTPSAAIMKEEIFGPVLPVVTFRTPDEAVSIIHRLGKPLSLYVFSGKEKNVEAYLGGTTSGGVCINNVMVQLSNPDLPFGGVGPSGLGSYHGEAGLRAFSHERSVMRQGKPVSARFFYPPYTGAKRKLVALLMKLTG